MSLAIPNASARQKSGESSSPIGQAANRRHAVSKEALSEAHGGRLWVSPNKPRGAAFQFTLPPRHGTRPFRPGTPAKRRKVPPAISMNERLDVDVERFKATIPACEAINLLKLSPADFG
jgi:hypothetical protein